MKKAICTALFAGILLMQATSDAQTPAAQSKITSSSSVGATPAKPNQATTANGSAAPSSPTIIALPADIASLTAKEILSANNQVVSQVASMYQNLGLFITIIVSLVGVGVAVISYIARKNLHEFTQEWTKKLESVEKDMQEKWTKKLESVDKDMQEKLSRIDVEVAAAKESAKKAAGHEQSIADSAKVVGQTLKDNDALKERVASLFAQIRGEAVSPVTQPATEAGGDQPVPESLATEEDAEVAARLKDKINSSEGGRQKP